MRFSSVLRSHAASRTGARPERGPHVPPPGTAEPAAPVATSPSVAAEPPPDDLDQRVRMVGEWQLGEA